MADSQVTYLRYWTQRILATCWLQLGDLALPTKRRWTTDYVGILPNPDPDDGGDVMWRDSLKIPVPLRRMTSFVAC